MIKVGCCNLRGLNDPLKQKEVGRLIRDNKLVMIDIVETHIRESNKDRIRSNIFFTW